MESNTSNYGLADENREVEEPQGEGDDDDSYGSDGFEVEDGSVQEESIDDDIEVLSEDASNQENDSYDFGGGDQSSRSQEAGSASLKSRSRADDEEEEDEYDFGGIEGPTEESQSQSFADFDISVNEQEVSSVSALDKRCTHIEDVA